jgi:hypothetical protein
MQTNALTPAQLERLPQLPPPEKYTLFRETYPEFLYESYEIDETADTIRLTFHFSVPGLADFAPQWTLPRPAQPVCPVNSGVFRRLVFSLGLVELVSYWKIACPPVVKIACGRITAAQADWWKKQYLSGLGEFFYRNGIPANFADFMRIESAGEDFTSAAEEQYPLHGCLIPVGGGKDSIVTLTLLQDLKEDSFCYVMNSRGATDASARTAGYRPEQILGIKRTLDKNMLDLNKLGYLNGHTPFSALVAFSGVLMAVLYGKEYVVLSNESSANESTVKDSDVNHQYSKSFQFESDFSDYQKAYIGSGVHYFSLLRPWSEFQIAACFASLKQFHPVFRSCNVGSKTDSWCGKCAKCLFVALLLTPFLDDAAIHAIFGREILQDESLVPLLQELCGMTEEKPFECVGSREEISTAMMLGIRVRQQKGQPLPALLDYFSSTEIYTRTLAGGNRYFSYYQTENLLPPAFDARMRRETEKLRERYANSL